MAKGKAKTNNSSVSLTPPQPWSFRSRKRECPSDETSETDDIQATHHHQDTAGDNSAVATLCHQPPLQESTMMISLQREAAEQSCLTKQDPDAEEKQAEATNVAVKAFEEQEETTVTNPSDDSQLEGFRVHGDNDASKNGTVMEEMTAEKCKRSPSQTCPDQPQVLQVSEEGDALEVKLDAKENSLCNPEKKQEELNDVYMADVKEITKEASAGLPAKKKRRMGVCGLTEKERSRFLQIKKSENGQNEQERDEKQICNNTADLVAQEEIVSSPALSCSQSIPVNCVTVLNETEIKLQSGHCGEDDRADTEVHTAVTTSDGTSAVCDPGCSKGKSDEEEGGIAPDPKQTGDTKSDPSAEEEEEELLGDQKELEGSTAQIVAEKPLEQMKDGEDGSAAGDQSLVISFYSNLTKNEETENQDAIEAAPLQVNDVTRTRDEEKEELTGDAGDGDGAEAGASSTNCNSAGFNTVEFCEAAATPSGSERKDNCDSDDEPSAGPSTMIAESPQTKDTTDLFGSGYLDYVSDSQLNTIILTEEEVMGRGEDFGCPDHEDASDLICGLIRELSSLNRKVMATHRELENLRRSSKSSRSAIR